MKSKAKTIETSLEMHLILHFCNRLKLDYLSNLVWKSDQNVPEPKMSSHSKSSPKIS